MAKKKEKVHYNQLTEIELLKELSTHRQDLFKARFRASTAPLKNPMEIRTLRKEIARLMTFLSMKTKADAVSSGANSKNGRAKA